MSRFSSDAKSRASKKAKALHEQLRADVDAAAMEAARARAEENKRELGRREDPNLPWWLA